MIKETGHTFRILELIKIASIRSSMHNAITSCFQSLRFDEGSAARATLLAFQET